MRPYEAFVAAQRLRVMETLARMAVFTVLISGVSLVNARADDASVYVAGKARRAMSALGQKPTFNHVGPMSALPPKADSCSVCPCHLSER